MNILGHRGIRQEESKSKPYQNTKQAIKYALKNGAEGVEIDVFLNFDKKSVVIHDAEIRKHSIFNEGNIKNTSNLELKKIRVGKFKKFKIPYLIDILEIFIENKDKILNIELKQKGIQNYVLQEILNSKINKNKIIISSFNWIDLKEIRELNKDIKLGLLFHNKEKDFENYAIKVQKKLGNTIYIPEKNCNFLRINNSEIEKYYWTLKKQDIELYDKIKTYNNSNIITDYPEFFSKL
jgi:glycerophosphoryl diester phosphodiesterase